MNKNTFRIIPAFLFLVVAGFALFRSGDLVEAGIWMCFALAILIPGIPGPDDKVKTWQGYVASMFIVIGLILLVLRITGLLPPPVRPLPLQF